MYDKQFQIQRGRRVQNPALRRPARERRCQLGKRQGEARGHAEIHETALDALKPDLAVYMGDICAASRDDIGMESFKRQFERLIAPVVERKDSVRDNNGQPRPRLRARRADGDFRETPNTA